MSYVTCSHWHYLEMSLPAMLCYAMLSDILSGSSLITGIWNLGQGLGLGIAYSIQSWEYSCTSMAKKVWQPPWLLPWHGCMAMAMVFRSRPRLSRVLSSSIHSWQYANIWYGSLNSPKQSSQSSRGKSRAKSRAKWRKWSQSMDFPSFLHIAL